MLKGWVRRIRTLIEHAVVYDGIAGIARRVEDALPMRIDSVWQQLALSGHANGAERWPLSGAKRTWLKDGAMSAYDPKRS
jgi:hypothetical protein